MDRDFGALNWRRDAGEQDVLLVRQHLRPPVPNTTFPPIRIGGGAHMTPGLFGNAIDYGLLHEDLIFGTSGADGSGVP